MNKMPWCEEHCQPDPFQTYRTLCRIAIISCSCDQYSGPRNKSQQIFKD
jgi:hypothetical protein